ncbi:MAG: NUDIX domain-containing protein, partial [bacterium]|nr:NUDIX domain-containing protein [bacterium]
ARREALEETSLEVELIRQFHAYSDPRRDPRQHNVTVVFIARPLGGALRGRDDARRAAVFPKNALPAPLAFDHGEILADYLAGKY